MMRDGFTKPLTSKCEFSSGVYVLNTSFHEAKATQAEEIALKTFKGFRTEHMITGQNSDSYYNLLPEHDLGGLSNFFNRVNRKISIKNIIDVGANIGLASLLMSEICPSAHIYAFEPAPITFETLNKNIWENLSGAFITPTLSAVGARDGSIRFAIDDRNSSANHATVDETGIDVRLTCLDSFVKNSGLESVDFIKIDVEGFERSVFEGARSVIFNHRPVIMFEYNEYALRTNANEEPDHALAAIMSILGQLGVVDPLTGEATLLSTHPQEAYEQLKSKNDSPFAVFDLVNGRF